MGGSLRGGREFFFFFKKSNILFVVGAGGIGGQRVSVVPNSPCTDYRFLYKGKTKGREYNFSTFNQYNFSVDKS